MKLQEEIRKRKEEIQLLIAAGNVEKAFKRSMDFVADFASNRTSMQKLISLNSIFTMVKSANGTQNGQANSFQTKKNTIVMEMLQLIDDIECDQLP